MSAAKVQPQQQALRLEHIIYSYCEIVENSLELLLPKCPANNATNLPKTIPLVPTTSRPGATALCLITKRRRFAR